MKHIKFEENLEGDEAYSNFAKDKNADTKKAPGIAKNFAESLEYDEARKWYHQLPDEPLDSEALSEDKIKLLKTEASSALHDDTMAYETRSSKNKSSDHQWARTLLKKGAIGDRVAAATILIQDSPLYNLPILRNLVNNVKPAKKKDGIVIIDTLSELFVSDLLIPEVKLRKFEEHTLSKVDEISSGNKHQRRNILKLWYFEDQLKDLYGTYIEALNNFAHDSVDTNKEKAVSAMSYLLVHHPEREKILLSNIINKLGDRTHSVASKVIYHLCELLYNHPNMKKVVLGEIEKMLFRSNISPKAQYYGVCFLNQFYLHKDDSLIAESLINIYFSFFKASIKKGDIDSRLMSAILTGVKRAYPFADKSKMAAANSHADALHKLVQLGGATVAVHALALLYQISGASDGTSDRFYSALYRKLGSADVFSLSRPAVLFHLVYRCMSEERDTSRLCSYVRRLLQLSCSMPPHHACAVLLTLSQVLKGKGRSNVIKYTWNLPDIKEEVKDEPEIVEDANDREGNDEDASGAKENDETIEQDEAEKTQDPGGKSQDGMTLENEEEKEVKDGKIDLLKGSKRDLLEEDSEEEYIDLKMDEDGNVKPRKRRKNDTKIGWYHVRVKKDSECQEDENVAETKDMEAKIQLKKAINMEKEITNYDPVARNPSFSGAEKTAFAELLPLMNHYHPSVKLFAENLYNGTLTKYTGDPIQDFSAIRFLDRFVFKNPKKIAKHEEPEGELKKVKGSHPKFAVRKNYRAKGLRSLPVNSNSYLNADEKKIPVDEKFLYDFLQKRRGAEQVDEEIDSDADSVTSEDFDKYLDSVTGAKDQDDSADEMDFLSEVRDALGKKAAKKKGEGDDDDELGGDSDDDKAPDEDVEGASDDEGSDGDLQISGEDEPSLSGDEDELALEGSGSDDEMAPVLGGKKSTFKPVKGKGDIGSLFASAEEFSSLLEENSSSKHQGSSQAVSNADNSSQKQLAWEDKRNSWLRGYSQKVHGSKKKENFGKGKFGGKDRFDSDSKFGGSGGKFGGSGRKFGGGSSSKFDGSGGKFGSSANKFGGSGRKFGGTDGKFIGSGGKFGGSGVKFGGSGGKFNNAGRKFNKGESKNFKQHQGKNFGGKRKDNFSGHGGKRQKFDN